MQLLSLKYNKIECLKQIFFTLINDILLIGNDVGMFTSVKLWLSKTFLMKNLGKATYIIGIRVYRDRLKRMIGSS